MVLAVYYYSMDYLDPRKRRRHTILLYIGYVLIAVAIFIATIVLLYQANGFGISKKGTVIQNGLVFISSQPRPANIYINGQLQSPKTNTRIALPEAPYDLKIARNGYQDWQRKVLIQGGQVEHFDYPLLIPKKIITNKLTPYDQNPSVFSQSPDKRWLLIGQPNDYRNFDVYDLKNPTKPSIVITVPDTVVSSAKTSQSWQVIEWADDSQHLLLQHLYDGAAEYVLVDRQAPEQSVNLSQTSGFKTGLLSLKDKKYDQYYIYDNQSLTLSQVSLRAPAPSVVLTGVIAFKPYGNDTILYATAIGASSGKVRIQLRVGDKNYTIRSVAANSSYLLDIAKYQNTFYLIAGATTENKVYLYSDPVGQIGSDVFTAPTPTQVMRIIAPNFVGFSSTAQYVVAENGAQFSVYDIEKKHGFNYTTTQVVDVPQVHASWMDGNRLTYISGGQQLIFDYDYQNVHNLGKANATYKPVFAPDYKYSYTLAPGNGTQLVLSQTGLLIPSEL